VTFADYAQWQQEARASRVAPSRDVIVEPVAKGPALPARERDRSKRLGYLEQREWDGMERAIIEAETAVEACRQAAEDPDIASDPTALRSRYEALAVARARVDRLYARWAELEARRA
jgi:ATP-binding cassette subfamily F protein uup